jgi:hypothetical protein
MGSIGEVSAGSGDESRMHQRAAESFSNISLTLDDIESTYFALDNSLPDVTALTMANAACTSPCTAVLRIHDASRPAVHQRPKLRHDDDRIDS